MYQFFNQDVDGPTVPPPQQNESTIQDDLAPSPHLDNLHLQLDQLNVFSRTAFNRIIATRTGYIKKIIAPGSPSETALISLIEFDNKILNIVEKKGRSNQAFKCKLISYDLDLFDNKISKKASFDLWEVVIQFIFTHSVFRLFKDFCERFISSHSNRPETFVFVSSLKYAQTLNFELARAYNLKGLELHETSSELYMNLLKIELNHAEFRRNELSDQDPNNIDDSLKIICNGEFVAAVFERALKNIICAESNLTFYKNMVQECERFHWTSEIRHNLILSILKKCPRSELWHDLYARSLRKADNRGNFFNEFSGACEHYALILGLTEFSSTRDPEFLRNVILNTEAMWNLALNFLFEIRNERSDYQAALEPRLESFLRKAYEIDKIGLSHLMQWKRILQMRNNHTFEGEEEEKKIRELMAFACSNPRLNKQIELWMDRYRTLLEMHASVQEFYDFFIEAINIMEDSAVPIYDLAFQFFNLRDKQLLIKFYILGSDATMYENVCVHVRCAYIEYLSLEQDNLNKAIDVYKQLCQKEPFSIKFHSTMYDILVSHLTSEGNVVTLLEDMASCRACATSQFGKTEPSVWIDRLKHDLEYNGGQKKEEISEKAHYQLSKDPDVRAEYDSKFCALTMTAAWKVQPKDFNTLGIAKP